MIDLLLRIMHSVNYAPDDEGGAPAPEASGDPDPSAKDENGKTADDRIREKLHPEEAILYGDKDTEGDDKDTEGDDKDTEGDDKDTEGDDKDDEPEVDLATVPEDGKYKISIPEDMDMDEELLAEMEPLWKKKGTTHAEAQELVDKYVAGLNKQVANIQDTQAETVNKWYDETTADKEFGGAKLEANVALAKKSIDAYGDDELKKVLVSSGVGNNLAVLKYMAKVGATVSDDDVPTDGGNPQPNLSEAGAEDILYGKTTPAKRD